MINFINENKFRSLAEYDMMDLSILNKSSILFFQYSELETIFHSLRQSSNNYILISHGYDDSIDYTSFNKKPICIKKWFAQNVQYKHPDLIPIPIGIPATGYRNRIKDIEWLIENAEKLQRTPKNINTVYCSWNPYNMPIRKEVLNNLKVNSIWDYPQPFITYCQNSAKHKFVISPPGHGIDCYRTWEALYMGCFPIVIKNGMYDSWDGLPIIQVNNYSEVTQDLLNYVLTLEYNYEKLDMKYWENLILKYVT